jgi:SAM-dependent methyltransferase
VGGVYRWATSILPQRLDAVVRPEKQTVKEFYDSFGWRKDSAGRYNDTAVFVDLRSVSRWYHHKVHRRLARWFGRGGYFLDAGSGPIAHSEYLLYSRGYRRRVCVDLSEIALAEARSKSGRHGLYVVADLAQLPFRDGVFDATICAHVLYHVPSNEQATVLSELYRTLAHDGICVVVYSQFRSLADRVPALVASILAWLRGAAGAPHRGREPSIDHAVPDAAPPDLYGHAHDRQWFRETLPAEWDVETRCCAIADRSFMERFVPDNLIGRCMMAVIYWLESALPHTLAWTVYQTIIIRKRVRRVDAAAVGRRRAPA